MRLFFTNKMEHLSLDFDQLQPVLTLSILDKLIVAMDGFAQLTQF